jgi:hypothetical protein
MKRAMVFLTLMLTLVTCKKKNANTEPTENVTATEVTFGQAASPTVINNTSGKVDVDGDGNDDLALISESVKTGPGPSYGTRYTLKCLNEETRLRSRSYTQSLVSFTSVTVETKTVNGTSTVFKTTSHIQTCNATAGAAATSQTTSERPISFNFGDKANMFEPQVGGTHIILDVSSEWKQIEPSSSQDTTFVSEFKSNVDCNKTVHDGDNYFCFISTRQGQKSRIGWIKIVKTGPSLALTEMMIAP